MSFDFLIKLRNKTGKEKKKILIVSTVLIMIIIIVVWFCLIDIFVVENKNTTQSNFIFIEMVKGLFNNIENVFTK